MTTLSDALQAAASYWEAKGPSSRMMAIRANACAEVLGMRQRIELLGPPEATRVLTHLHKTKSKGSVPAYYAAFKRCVDMAGGDTRGWPKAGSAPRKCREPLSELDLDRLAEKLAGRSYRYKTDEAGIRMYGYVVISGPDTEGDYTIRGSDWETYDLLELLRGTGMRVEREALNGEALQWNSETATLKITGKGQHERVIPVKRLETVGLLNSPKRMAKMRSLGYSGHLKRWNAALDRMRYTEIGEITSLKPTPHAVRHYYATAAYKRSGRNLRAVQELLGHSDISTTARYLGVDMDELRGAVG